jgi:Transposase DDE domain group 1
VTSCCIPQLTFSFYRHRSIRADFSGGQITSDAGLLPLRAFDERHSLTRSLAELLGDPRDEERVRHSALSLFRQRIYQIVAGYEDANDADRLRNDPAFSSVSFHGPSFLSFLLLFSFFVPRSSFPQRNVVPGSPRNDDLQLGRPAACAALSLLKRFALSQSKSPLASDSPTTDAGVRDCKM